MGNLGAHIFGEFNQNIMFDAKSKLNLMFSDPGHVVSCVERPQFFFVSQCIISHTKVLATYLIIRIGSHVV